MNESPRTKVFIATFAVMSALFCAWQATMHLTKYLNILDFDSANSDGVTYDSGCLSGTFTDNLLAEDRMAKICKDSTDCADESSNWTFLYLFNGVIYSVLGLNFILLSVGACNVYLRYISGFMFCLSGSAYLYAIYQTYSNSSMNEDHYSTLCELNLGTSYHASGLMEELSEDSIPKTFAEDSRLLLALLLYQVSFLPMCMSVGLCPLFRFRP